MSERAFAAQRQRQSLHPSVTLMRTVSVDSIRKLIKSREVDLTMVRSEGVHTLSLRGQFNDYGDFFRITATGVEFVELAGTIILGEIVLAHFGTVAALCPKWALMASWYSGHALAIRSADTESWNDSVHCFVIVADEFSFTAGPNWPAHLPTEGE